MSASLLMAVILPISLCAQTVVNVASDNPPSEGSLNKAVQAAIVAGTLSNTTFQLEPHGYYVLTGTINVPAGQKLTIVAPDPGTTQATAPAQIVWSSSSSVNTQYNFDCFGDISLKNIWLMYATTTGNQVGSCLQIEEDPLAKERFGNFEGVIFDYSPTPQNIASGAVSVTCTKFNGTFKNCYFKNCIDRHWRYYGRALSFPYSSTGWHSDSVSFVNTTFANLGYVYMQEGGEYADYVKFNHCTFLNVVMFPLESGWWRTLSVTNSIFVNTYMLGNIPAQTGTGDPNGGTIRIDSVRSFGFGFPFTDQDRRILFANSSYFMEKWLTDWMVNNPYSKSMHTNGQDNMIPVAQSMLSPRTRVFFDSTANGRKVFPYINRTNLYDATDPGFVHPPTDTAVLKIFMYKKWNDDTDTNWAWKPQNDVNALWPLEENISYTNATLKTAGLGGFPLGDLYHWWPTQYASWNAQEATENQNIWYMLTNGSPNSPTLVAPANGAKNQSTSVTLSWTASVGGTSYRLQVSTDQNFGTTAVNDSTLTGTSRQVGPLMGATTYYWRINATNFYGTSPWSSTGSFTTLPNPPNKIMLVYPDSNSQNVYQNDWLTWQGDNAATSYHIDISQSPLFSAIFDSVTIVGTSYRKPTRLFTPASTYFWRVRGSNIGGDGQFSSVWSFKAGNTSRYPVTSYSTSTFAFGNVKVGQYRDTTVTISSMGNDTLKITSISSLNPAFGVRPTNKNVPLGQSFADTIRFMPTAIGTTATAIVINSNTSVGVDTIKVSGFGYGQGVASINTTNVLLGRIRIGQYGDTTITISNTGNDTLKIASLVSSNVVFSVRISSRMLPPGQFLIDTIRFTPAVIGTANASIVVTSNSPTSPDTIRISGFGYGQGILSLNTAMISFGNVKVGQYKDAVVNISNGGNDTLKISSISSSVSEFRAQLTSMTIPPGKSLFVDTIRFVPTNGRLYSATITVTSNSPSSPDTVGVTGLGLIGGLGASSSTIDFGKAKLGQRRDTIVTIRSMGNDTLSISEMTVVGAAFTLRTFRPVVPPGTSVSDSLQYAPSSLGSASGVLIIKSNAPSSPDTVRLLGFCATYGLKISPAAIDFGLVLVGKSKDTTITFNNTGNDTLRLVSIGSTIQSVTAMPTALNILPNVSLTDAIRFTPASVGPVSGALIITSNGPTSPDTIKITGSGVTATTGIAREGIPIEFGLQQNYPNPFNPSTAIRFELPKSANVTLKVFNALGQQVALLVNEQKEPGYYEATWNANVPSGIYFYRLQAGEYMETKKMVVLK
jgi:hypothetical protein